MNTTLMNIADVRHDFPIFKTLNRGKPLVYLDSANSAQKPRQVVNAMAEFSLQEYANVHRGIYELSERATQSYAGARKQVQQFINAAKAEEIIFVSGTTEGINLVAESYGRTHWQAGDEVILSEMEHHSNIVPWYLLKERLGIVLKVIPVNDDGSLNIEVYQNLFSARTKLVAVSHASNAMGTINPIKAMTAFAHSKGVPVLVDGAQAIPHLPVNVQDLACDFYVFSAHKLYGPTGIGVLYAKKALLDVMSPYQGGGSMIETVAFDKITFAKAPEKFEAGTPNIVGVKGLTTAIQYLQTLGMENIAAHEQELLAYAEEKLPQVPGLRIIGTAKPKVSVISFVIDGLHPHDIGTVLDHEGVAVRAGHHCAMPLIERFKVPATVRASFGIYNTKHDVDALVHALLEAKRIFA